MASHRIPEYRQVVDEIIKRTRLKNRFRQPVDVGDTVLFYSARPVCPPHDALEDATDENPIIAVVNVTKVEPGPDANYPYFIQWDAVTTASY